MALDVHTSLANALFAHERAASTKVRPHEKSAAKAPTNATALDSLPSNRVSSHSFDALVSEKAPASNGTQKATAASFSARSRGAMPGQIAGHQDTVVMPRESAPKVQAEALAKPEGEQKEASAVRKPDAAGREKAENAEAPGVNANGREETSPTKAEEASSEQECAQQEGGDQTGQEARQEQDSETVPGAETSGEDAVIVSVAPEGVMLVGEAAVASTTAPAGDTLATEGETVLSVGGVTKDGSAAMLLVGTTSAEGNDSAQTVVGVPEEAVNARATPAKADVTQIGAPQDLDLQTGMTRHGEAKFEQMAEAATEASVAKGSKAAKGTGEGGLEPKVGHAQPGEGPALRGSVFTQVLSDFAGEHGFSRGPDLLSALDRPVAAAAQANRGADVQRPTPLQMLPIEIGMQAVRGAREFQIRLDPSELGRVDVKLQINDKGEVNASLVVERPETLQMLRRDATTLAQAFEQAGLKQGENSLSFSLKGENQQGQQQQQAGRNASVQDSEDAALQAQIGEIAMRRVMIPNSSLDLMV